MDQFDDVERQIIGAHVLDEVLVRSDFQNTLVLCPISEHGPPTREAEPRHQPLEAVCPVSGLTEPDMHGVERKAWLHRRPKYR